MATTDFSSIMILLFISRVLYKWNHRTCNLGVFVFKVFSMLNGNMWVLKSSWLVWLKIFTSPETYSNQELKTTWHCMLIEQARQDPFHTDFFVKCCFVGFGLIYMKDCGLGGISTPLPLYFSLSPFGLL